jgi:hypothetical protein
MYEYIGNLIGRFFFWCVDVLVFIGDITGMGYALANIVIFVILQPLLILLFFILWRREIKKYKTEVTHQSLSIKKL